MASTTEIKLFKADTILDVTEKNALYCIKSPTDTEFRIIVTDKFGNPVNQKDNSGSGTTNIVSNDGSIIITGTTTKNLQIASSLQTLINSALQSGNNISELFNDVGYITLTDIPGFNPLNWDLEDFTNIGADPFVKQSQLPTKTSDLSNDSNFVSDAFYTHTDNNYTSVEKSKLAGIEAGAEVNNISDTNATDLTDGGETTLHKHDSRYYTESEVDSFLSGKFNTPAGNSTQYLNGLGTPTAFPSIPSNTSDLSNDSGFIADAPNNSNAYVRSGLAWVVSYTKSAIDTLLNNKVNTSRTINTKALTSDVVLNQDDVLDGTTYKQYSVTEKNKLASITEIFTTALKTAYDSAYTWITTNGTNVLNHLSNTSNPHNVTKSQVGLSNVDNTSDVNKPVSTAQATAIGLKEDLSNKTSSIAGNESSNVLFATIKGWIDWFKDGFIGVLPAKATNLVDADVLVIGDSADSNKTKTRTWAQIKANLASVFFLDATSSIQTQLNAKAVDSAVVHNTGNETIAGTKTFSNSVICLTGFFSNAGGLQNSSNANNAKGAPTNNGFQISRNVADSNPANVVDLINALSTGNIEEWKWQSVLKAYIDRNGNFNANSVILPAGNIQTQLDAKVDKSSWVDYSSTSTIVGWSSFTAKQIDIYIVGNSLTCVYSISGTSNSATTSFTVSNNNTSLNTMVKLDVYHADNGTVSTTPGRVIITSGSNVATFTRGGTGTNFTGSGIKTIVGQFTIKIN